MKSENFEKNNTDQIIPIKEIEKIFSDFYSKVFTLISEIEDIERNIKNED